MEIMDRIEKEDRSFLHDIAGPIFTVKASLQRAIKELATGDLEAEKVKRTLERLEKALENIKKIENLHAEQKHIITSRGLR
jgi:hypothetical protein